MNQSYTAALTKLIVPLKLEQQLIAMAAALLGHHKLPVFSPFLLGQGPAKAKQPLLERALPLLIRGVCLHMANDKCHCPPLCGPDIEV